MVRVFAHGASDRSFMVDPLGYFSFLPMLHDWCNKGSGMCYFVCGMMPIKEPYKRAYVAAAGFLSPYLSDSLPYICLMPYNRK